MELREVGSKGRKWKRAEDCDCWQVFALAQLNICVVLTWGRHIANICWQELALVQLNICVLPTWGWHIANICWQVLALVRLNICVILMWFVLAWLNLYVLLNGEVGASILLMSACRCWY